MSTSRTAAVHAAGALVWRETDHRLEVLLVHRPRYRDWSWPKGKVDPGESLPAAAVREVAEETGVTIVLGIPLPGLHYRLNDGKPKHVHYWAARPADEDGDARALSVRPPVEPASTDEVDEAVWVGVDAARDLLTRKADRTPLAALLQAWEKGRLHTRTTTIVRHGRARRRSAWRRGEQSRPLTPKGAAQSVALVPVLSAFGVREVVTSPWRRCLSTVEPYASKAGIRLAADKALTEAAHHEDPDQASEVLDELIARPRDVALCTHRPLLGAIIDTIGEATRRWTVGTLPTRDPYLRTGEVLVSHIVGRGHRARIVAVERHRPPSGL
ncbi:NUDIX hydrolase [Cellulomonas bogoriensis]|uniref:NTP pyrophosphohydrolase n=1 Tax=Cellulomonas bogoriensis 69B4 = DSM 16987 TaxID=1386082 RepID=A0A0A0BXD0_9CELL|nr:NUDIX hydrolase [Cellulomonas bogoriensis]KGM11799.1 NTP pyrophosphohydrolase [Cellulomonas bogoriensis 69B4 = DSM 16987]